jgi:hypothetical protein
MEQSLPAQIDGLESGESWERRFLKTLGVLALTIPLLTVNGFLAEVAQFKASLASYETLTIDWDVVPGVLLRMGVINLVSFPIIFYVCAAVTFVAARVLGGKGGFWDHGYAIAIAYLKVVGLALAVLGLASLTTIAGILGLVIPVALIKLVGEALTSVHGLSTKRGCVAMVPLVLLPILAVAILALLG